MFSMEYKVRKADGSDAEDIYSLLRQLKGEEMEYDAFLNRYLDNLENPAYEYWVLEEGGAIRGLVSSHMSQPLHHPEKVCEVQELIVDNGYRGKGMGSCLLKWVLSRHAGDNIELASNRSRRKARGFYERMGFLATHNKFVYRKP